MRHGDDWIAAVAAGDELLGALVLRGHPGLDPVDQRTLERAAMVTSLLLLARRSAAEAEQRVRGELLDDLLDARDRDPGCCATARRLRADLDATHAVLAARLEGGTADADQEADAHAAPVGRRLPSRRDPARPRCRPRRRHGPAAAAGPGDTATDLARRTARELGTAVHEPVTVGASAPVGRLLAKPHTVATAYAEARRCLDTLRLLGRAGDGSAAEDFGFLGLLLAGSGTSPASSTAPSAGSWRTTNGVGPSCCARWTPISRAG